MKHIGTTVRQQAPMRDDLEWAPVGMVARDLAMLEGDLREAAASVRCLNRALIRATAHPQDGWETEDIRMLMRSLCSPNVLMQGQGADDEVGALCSYVGSCSRRRYHVPGLRSRALTSGVVGQHRGARIHHRPRRCRRQLLDGGRRLHPVE